jgi:hypothetical protein
VPPFEQQLARGVKGRQAQAVRRGTEVAATHHDEMVTPVEGDAPHAEQLQLAFVVDAAKPTSDRRGVDVDGFLTLEA